MYKKQIRTVFILFFLIFFGHVNTVWCNVREDIENLQPGEWYEIAHSELKKSGVLPEPAPPGNAGVHAVMGAWNGGAYDTKRERLIIWGGGHTDYSGNEIYAFNMNTFTWERIWGPTPNKMIPNDYRAYQTYEDGNPSARHTFAGLQYIPKMDTLWSHGSSVWKSSNGKELPYIATWQFHMDKSWWEMKGDLPNVHGSRVSAYDSKTGHIFSRSVTGIHEYDPVTGEWTKLYTYTAGWWYLANAAIDPVKRKMVMIGQGTFEVFDLETHQLKTYKMSDIKGDVEILMIKAPGFEFVSRLNAFVAWAADESLGIVPGTAYVIDPSKLVIEKRYPKSETIEHIPQKSAYYGTYGRFRYIPSMDVFVVVNNIFTNVYVYKLSDIKIPPPDFYATKKMGKLRVNPTRFAIGIEWDLDKNYISKDPNNNATVSVQYKTTDTQKWSDALDLVRVNEFDLNMMAGSIMFLDPDTEYDVQLNYSDPDGGQWTYNVKTKTMRIPQLPEKGRKFYVVPGKGGGDGSQTNPFKGLSEAKKAAAPGDVFYIGSGTYNGIINFNKPGTPEQYIVWKGTGNDDVIFENKIFVSAGYNWFEGIFFHVGEDCKGIQALGDKFSNSPEGIVIKNNLFSGGKGCKSIFYMIHGVPHARNWYITDNVIKGPLKPGVKTFSGEGIDMGFHTPYNTGHTIAHNRISNVADGMSYMGGNCDIFGNDIFDVIDDGIEPDYGSANVRIYKNRISMAQNNAISLQDFDNGMPWYIIRNQIISFGENVLKIRQRENQFAFYHNTVVNLYGMFKYQPEYALYGHSKNNIMVSIQYGKLWDFKYLTPNWKTDIDYNAFYWGKAKYPFQYRGKYYTDLKSYSAGSGFDLNSIVIDPGKCFNNLIIPDPVPAPVPMQFLTLIPGCSAIDRGTYLPNINDDYNGLSPDMGAYESGDNLPHYGPRLQ